jgi:hypothetical protein
MSLSPGDIEREREADRAQDRRTARCVDRVLLGHPLPVVVHNALLEFANRLSMGDTDGALPGEPDYQEPPSPDRKTPTPPPPR